MSENNLGVPADETREGSPAADAVPAAATGGRVDTVKTAATPAGETAAAPAAAAVPTVDPRLLVQEEGLRGYLTAFGRRMRSGELGSVPVVAALILIWAIFGIANGNFLSSDNFATIAQVVVGYGLMALGIVFVLLLGEIDLSVSYVGGVAGAVYGILTVYHGVPEGLALILAILSGTVLGLFHGVFFAKVGVPAFVVTLAGFLAWNGLMLQILGNHGTINLRADGLLSQLFNYTFDDVAFAYVLALIAVVLYLVAALRDAGKRRRAGIPARPTTDIVVKTAGLAVLSFLAAYILNQSTGMLLDLLIFLVFVVVGDLVLRRTTYGRQIFAVGGGIEAARRAGVNVDWVRISVFMISGTLAAVGGLFLAGQVNSAQSSAGGGITLMIAIAAAVIGGTSLFGGRGSTWSALLGSLVIISIQQGLYVLGLGTAIQDMVTGAVLLASVTIDSLSRRTQKAAGRA